MLKEIDKGNFSCFKFRKNGLHVKFHLYVSIEKQFSKTHAPNVWVNAG
tara:strand:- start:354 stop:497 length:144 start_codon:yes stop_codon:yes gene_type:complete